MSTPGFEPDIKGPISFEAHIVGFNAGILFELKNKGSVIKRALTEGQAVSGFILPETLFFRNIEIQIIHMLKCIFLRWGLGQRAL